MIYESYPWKQDLRRRKNLLIRYNTAEQFEKDDDKAYTVIEKAIFYSAFIIRKLHECDKLSTEADSRKLHISKYPAKREFNKIHHSLKEDSHRWEQGIHIDVPARDVCNWLIHSFIFEILFDEFGKVESFAVSSDFDRNEWLYIIDLSDWIEYMDFVASDFVVASNYHVRKVKQKKNKEIFDYVATYKERGTM